ncbi:DUF4386 domain-containing protein [Blastococcus sp. TF02A-35]|uniref:DUF4386 domain-containing protein n=1 Tax=Blastococcus sp. TF02A-35 TaxID=2559612 RepID=UPI0010741EE8|nr:DUF4386 domain-containing protein [Blastococcus sp. TF02A_35]TFV52846.1 DUF4386 domain-containing protein [Blastococcus sp. TF02A_35]
MGSTRTTAVVAGVFFVVAAVTAVIALALYQPALGDAEFVLGAGESTGVLVGGLLEVVLAASCIGTAVTLYPVVRQHGEGMALGYVCGRLLEAAVIVVGVVATLSLVTLRGTATGGDGEALVAVARALVAVHDWTFLVGPGLVIGVNSLLLAVLLHRSRLVPRGITVLGLVGGPLVLASSVAVMFGVYDQVSAWGFLGAVVVAVWEMALAYRLVVTGFRAPAPVPASVRAVAA